MSATAAAAHGHLAVSTTGCPVRDGSVEDFESRAARIRSIEQSLFELDAFANQAGVRVVKNRIVHSASEDVPQRAEVACESLALKAQFC